jgi:hypothetical protein
MALKPDDTAESRKEWESALACNPGHLGARRRMMTLERKLAEAFLARKDLQAANVALAKAAVHAEVVAQLDPRDETARVLLEQYRKMIARKRGAGAGDTPPPLRKVR